MVVVGIATDANATVEVSGNTGLIDGENIVTITVTAACGCASNAYTFTINVLTLSNNADLSTFTINGVEVVDGSSIEVASEVDQAVVVAQAASANATIEITSSTALEVGDNTISVKVTSESGATVKTYSVTVKRAAPLSSNVNVTSISVDGTDVGAGGTFEAPAGTEAVDVTVVTEDAKASSEVLGNTGLKTGSNTIKVVVTAENGDTAQYNVYVNVAKSNNTGLASLSVNSYALDVEQPLAFEVSASTTSVAVVAVTSDVDASVVISGADNLVEGPNDVTITVTAADGITTKEYVLVVTRAPLSNNNDLGGITVNGETIEVDGTYTVDPGVTSVAVTATASDPDATVTVSGNTNLVSGPNLVTVTITAANGSEATYTFNVVVRTLSDDTTLTSFTINGTDVEDGVTIVLDGTKDFVTVVAKANDVAASVSVTGASNLKFGLNTITVTVTAENGTKADYTATVRYPNLADASLSTFTINGDAVNSGDSIDLDYGVTSVEVVATPTEEGATAEIEGGADLVSGENTVTVTVTAANGETTATYTVTLNVAFNSDTSLATFQVNGESVADGDVVELAAYTTEVEVTAEATDPDANVAITGGTELLAGENTLTVVVTAQNGDKKTYTVTLNVAQGNSVELSSFTVNGEDVADGDAVELDPYTTEVEVAVETADVNATYVITGATGLVRGENILTVVVSAADGSTSATYTVTLTVPAGNDTTLKTFQIEGNDVADGDSINVDYGTESVEITVETNDENATFAVVGGSELKAGENQVVVTVTAEDGSTADYTVTIVVL